MSEKTQKKSWFKGLSSEFKKIVWPDQDDTCETLGSRCYHFGNSGRDYCTD